MKKIIMFIIFSMALMGCSDGARTIKVLSDQGYTDIETTGYSFFACSKDDSFSTGFRAKSPSGKVVTGTVCSGWFKGATVRFD